MNEEGSGAPRSCAGSVNVVFSTVCASLLPHTTGGRWAGECELHRARAATPSLRRLRVAIDAARGYRAFLRHVPAGARRVVAVDRADGVWAAPDAVDATVYVRERKQRFTENP